MGRLGLRFFAGVARRLVAPLDVVLTSLRGLGDKNSGHTLRTMVTTGTAHLVHLVRRMLRFEGMRDNGLGVDISCNSVSSFLHDYTRIFIPLLKGEHRVLSFRDSPRRVSNFFSSSGLSGIVCGLLSGTTGCAPRSKQVSIGTELTSRRALRISVTGAKRLVARGAVSKLFGHFCRKSCQGRGAVNAKVNLSLMGSLVAVRQKAVRMFDGRRVNGYFHVLLPVRERTCRRKRVGRAVTTRARATFPIPVCVSRAVDSPSGGVRSLLQSSCAVLVISSGRRLYVLFSGLLSGYFQIGATVSNERTLGMLRRKNVSLIISSVVVPSVSNVRLYQCVGAGFRCDRVPIVLLATGHTRRDRVRKCGSKTSKCVDGPYGFSLLCTRVVGYLGERRHGKTSFQGRVIFRINGLRCASLSRAFLRQTVSYIGTHLDSTSFSRTRFIDRVNASQDMLARGLGSLAKLAPSTFIRGIQLATTYGLVSRRNGVEVDSLTFTINFGSSGCFDAYFGGGCNVAPGRCVRRKEG